MSSVIRLLCVVVAICGMSSAGSAASFEEVLRAQIVEAGFARPEAINPRADPALAALGAELFESPNTSLTSDISCSTCHIDSQGSADGLPVSAAIGGRGEGLERFHSGAKLLGRNALALWGRGAHTFQSFFWDGKVEDNDSAIVSQFGSKVPDADPLVVAIHLPVVEIREMVDETEFIRSRKQENVAVAYQVYDEIARNLTETEPKVSETLAGYFALPVNELRFVHFAKAIAEFFRSKFAIKESKLSRFVAGEAALSEEEVRGGLLFYGKGGCVNCHLGPHFSDFKYYAVPFPQLGFGKNGFGVDYGRYNVTFEVDDLYRFRTAPLWNVEKTAPFGHSGSVATLEDAVQAHYDPLAPVQLDKSDAYGRQELFRRLSKSREVADLAGYLSKAELKQVVAFLRTLSFDAKN